MTNLFSRSAVIVERLFYWFSTSCEIFKKKFKKINKIIWKFGLDCLIFDLSKTIKTFNDMKNTKKLKDLKVGDRFLAGPFPATVTSHGGPKSTHIEYKFDASPKKVFTATWVGSSSRPSKHKDKVVEVL